MRTIYLPVDSELHIKRERGNVVFLWYRRDEEEPCFRMYATPEHATNLAASVFGMMELPREPIAEVQA